MAHLELHEHAWRVVGSNVGAHGKDTWLVEGCPQLAPFSYVPHAVFGNTADMLQAVALVL